MNTKDRVPVLRQRVRRDGDRGAAARRQRVGGRLRGRRGEDPLRPERGQERGRDRGAARSSPRARMAARSRRSGTSPSASTRRSSTSARSSRSSSAARSTRPAPRGWGCSACSSRRSATGRSSQPTGSLGQGSIFDLGAFDADDSRVARAPPADPDRRVREAGAAAAREGDARPLRLRAPARARPRPAPPQDRRDARRARAPPRRRGRHGRRDRLGREAPDDEARRADGLPHARRPDRHRRGRRLQLRPTPPRASSA